MYRNTPLNSRHHMFKPVHIKLPEFVVPREAQFIIQHRFGDILALIRVNFLPVQKGSFAFDSSIHFVHERIENNAHDLLFFNH